MTIRVILFTDRQTDRQTVVKTVCTATIGGYIINYKLIFAIERVLLGFAALISP